MIFAYNEDGRLEVVADVAEARRQFQASDVESGAVTLFDDAGRELSPRFPHRSERKILGIRVSSDPGPFELEPDPDGERLVDTLGPTVVLMHNQWFPTLEAVHAYLKQRA